MKDEIQQQETQSLKEKIKILLKTLYRYDQEFDTSDYRHALGTCDYLEFVEFCREDHVDEVIKLEAEITKLRADVESLKCCGNCGYSTDRCYIGNGCDGNCATINGKETWQDWVKREV